MEETGLEICEMHQVHAYSEPGRDPRGHYISMVFAAKVKGELKAGDDAVDIKVFPFDQIPEDLAFDHNRFIKDYIGRRRIR